MKRRVAIFGGTFDPVHIGHLAIAEDARVALNVDRVIFVPAAQQPFKVGMRTAAAPDRLAMIRLAIQDNPAFEVSDLEIERGGTSYTVDTLDALTGRDPDGEYMLIVGADAALGIPRWHEPERVIRLARFAVVQRPGVVFDLATLTAALPSIAGRLVMIEGPAFDISASEIRERIRAHRPIRYHVPPSVWAYLREHPVYGGDSSDDTTRLAAGNG